MGWCTGTSATTTCWSEPTGELVFLDWGNASIGPLWVDPLLARLERVELPVVRRVPGVLPGARRGRRYRRRRLARRASPARLAWGAAHAVDVNLPTLNDFRISESRRMLVGAERRLGIA